MNIIISWVDIETNQILKWLCIHYGMYYFQSEMELISLLTKPQLRISDKSNINSCIVQGSFSPHRT